MRRNIKPASKLSRLENRVSKAPGDGKSILNAPYGARPDSEREEVRSGLIGLCHEIAGLIMRRHFEKNEVASIRREVRERLVGMMRCDVERAERLIDLSLELIHVKIHGRFQRNPLELSLLIARAGNQLREVSHN